MLGEYTDGRRRKSKRYSGLAWLAGLVYFKQQFTK
jgi:hypothetical protein